MKMLVSIFLVIVFTFSTIYANEKIEKTFRYNKVECTYSEATEIAEKAASDKFPEFKEKILNDEDNGFSEKHGGGEPETIIKEYVLEYKVIDKYKGQFQQYSYQTEKGTIYYHGSYFKDSINVTLNNPCEVVGVSRKSGKSYYTY